MCPFYMRMEVVSDVDSSCSDSDAPYESSSSSSEEEVIRKRSVKRTEKKKEVQKEEAPAKEEKPSETEALHSMQDPYKRNSFRIFGRINGRKIVILLDNGQRITSLQRKPLKSAMLP